MTTQQPRASDTAATASQQVSRDEMVRRVARRLTLVQRLVRLAAKQIMAEHGVSPEVLRIGAGQYHALHELAKADRLMAGELAGRCHVSEPTVSKMLKSLEASGLVERQTDPANRRVVWVRLTPAGRAIRDELKAHFEGALAQVLAGLDDAQLADLLVGLGHLEHVVGDPDADTDLGAGPEPHSHSDA
jgi:DNA-binding MarR family transcriptional regulator